MRSWADAAADEAAVPDIPQLCTARDGGVAGGADGHDFTTGDCCATSVTMPDSPLVGGRASAVLVVWLPALTAQQVSCQASTCLDALCGALSWSVAEGCILGLEGSVAPGSVLLAVSTSAVHPTETSLPACRSCCWQATTCRTLARQAAAGDGWGNSRSWICLAIASQPCRRRWLRRRRCSSCTCNSRCASCETLCSLCAIRADATHLNMGCDHSAELKHSIARCCTCICIEQDNDKHRTDITLRNHILPRGHRATLPPHATVACTSMTTYCCCALLVCTKDPAPHTGSVDHSVDVLQEGHL
jgi:hypothetical protein